MSIDSLPKIEREALQLLLSGDDVFCQPLRSQLSCVAKLERTETGAGIYIDFELGADAQPLEDLRSFRISDVFAISEKCGEIGFLLFVKDGLIDFLEAYAYTDSYPSYSDCDFKLEKGEAKVT